MSLSSRQVKQYRSIGHRLNPIINVSNGLSDNIHAELERALADHELIKLKVNPGDREEKKALMAEICAGHRAELVQLIGNVALIFRAAAQPDPKLSNLVRHRELLG